VGAAEFCEKTVRKFAEVVRNANARKPATRLRIDVIFVFPSIQALQIFQVNNDGDLIVN
jgi:hypothetical protein